MRGGWWAVTLVFAAAAAAADPLVVVRLGACCSQVAYGPGERALADELELQGVALVWEETDPSWSEDVVGALERRAKARSGVWVAVVRAAADRVRVVTVVTRDGAVYSRTTWEYPVGTPEADARFVTAAAAAVRGQWVAADSMEPPTASPKAGAAQPPESGAPAVRLTGERKTPRTDDGVRVGVDAGVAAAWSEGSQWGLGPVIQAMALWRHVALVATGWWSGGLGTVARGGLTTTWRSLGGDLGAMVGLRGTRVGLWAGVRAGGVRVRVRDADLGEQVERVGLVIPAVMGRLALGARWRMAVNAAVGVAVPDVQVLEEQRTVAVWGRPLVQVGMVVGYQWR